MWAYFWAFVELIIDRGDPKMALLLLAYPPVTGTQMHSLYSFTKICIFNAAVEPPGWQSWHHAAGGWAFLATTDNL